jgi:signal transduction histidine kinase
LGDSTQNRALMGIVLREVQRLNSLIADFLLFARPISPGRERIHLNRLFEEIFQMLANSPEFSALLRLETQFEDDLYIQGDPNQVRQVFWNLLVNAAQAMPEGGLLRVRARKAFPRAPVPGGRNYGEVSVIDSGMGIGEEAIGKVFDPFFTTKEKGTGLGLSIVHSIVESYGGKITVQSQRGRGSVFTVVLPLADPLAVVAAPMSPA